MKKSVSFKNSTLENEEQTKDDVLASALLAWLDFEYMLLTTAQPIKDKQQSELAEDSLSKLSLRNSIKN